MALKKDITDSKGVKTRYHSIKSFEYESGKLKVKLHSYVNQTTRDAEKKIQQQNLEAIDFDINLNNLRTELDGLLGKTDDESKARVAELSAQINELALKTDRPVFTEQSDNHYDEVEVHIDYFEPLSLGAIYDKLTETDRYNGSESI